MLSYYIIPAPQDRLEILRVMAAAGFSLKIRGAGFLIEDRTLPVLEASGLHHVTKELGRSEAPGPQFWSNWCSTSLELLMGRFCKSFDDGRSLRFTVVPPAEGSGEITRYEVRDESSLLLELDPTTLDNMWSAWGSGTPLKGAGHEEFEGVVGVRRGKWRLPYWEHTNRDLFKNGGLVNPWGMGLHPYPLTVAECLEAIALDRERNPVLYLKPEGL